MIYRLAGIISKWHHKSLCGVIYRLASSVCEWHHKSLCGMIYRFASSVSERHHKSLCGMIYRLASSVSEWHHKSWVTMWYDLQSSWHHESVSFLLLPWTWKFFGIGPSENFYVEATISSLPYHLHHPCPPPPPPTLISFLWTGWTPCVGVAFTLFIGTASRLTCSSSVAAHCLK